MLDVLEEESNYVFSPFWFGFFVIESSQVFFVLLLFSGSGMKVFNFYVCFFLFRLHSYGKSEDCCVCVGSVNLVLVL